MYTNVPVSVAVAAGNLFMLAPDIFCYDLVGFYNLFAIKVL